MGTKTLVRLLIALAVLGAIAAILHFAGSGGSVSEVGSSTNKKKVFADFPINDVGKIVIQEKEGSLTLSKGATSWEVAEREGYPANAEPVVGLLRKIWDLNIVQPITIGRTQYGRLGLLDPAASETPADEAATLLTFQDKDGKDLASLWLGKVYERNEGRPDPFSGGMARTDAGRYVKRGDANSVYLVGDTFSDVKTEAPEWIDKTFFRVESIQSIEYAPAEKTDGWKLERTDESGDFVLANAAAGEALDTNKVASMKSAFSNPQIEDVFVGEEKGQQKTEEATFKIATFDGFQYEISLGEKNDLNELPLVLDKVSAEWPKERKAGEEESDEEKKRLDKEFADRNESLTKKLEQEKRLEGHVFKVRSYIVDSIAKKRSELMEEKKEETKTEEVAPGVSLPVPALPAPAPEAKPEVPKPETPKAEAPAPVEAKPETEAKSEAPKPEMPKAEAPAPAEAKPETEAKSEAPKAEAPAPEKVEEAPAPKPEPAPEAKAEAAPEAPAPAPQPAEAPAVPQE